MRLDPLCEEKAKLTGVRVSRERLDELYNLYNRREFVHPDPLEFLYRYDSAEDRELVALLASALAYGRVSLILRNVDRLLELLGPAPAAFLRKSSARKLSNTFPGFKHRFTTGEELGALLVGVKRVLEEYGSLNACFSRGMDRRQETVVPAMCLFTSELTGMTGRPCTFLLPDPANGSACKRLNLFLRWMVRRDRVDPGGWTGVPRSKLVVPLDTHMYKVGLALGFTRRGSADLRTALEITEGFKRIVPRDPVRYDFALTRLGIRNGVSLEEFLRKD
jgi:uncharacterized protein (TIGR02757 family)